MYSLFPQFQFALLGDEPEPIAAGNAVPLQWVGSIATLPTGWDDAVERAFIRDVRRADTLCALAAVVDREHQGAGVSARVNETMKQFAVRRGLRRIIAPARPTWKSRHPLTPIERYWEEWAGMDYPESGSYVVPDALDLLRVDVVTDRAVYAEPNIWVLHPLDSTCAVPIRQE